MKTKRIGRCSTGLAALVAMFSAATLSATAHAAEATTGLQTTQEFRIAHCCHAHPYPPYDNNCCHPPSRTYVAPAYGVGPASVRGASRRTARRTSRRVSRRR